MDMEGFSVSNLSGDVLKYWGTISDSIQLMAKVQGVFLKALRSKHVDTKEASELPKFLLGIGNTYNWPKHVAIIDSMSHFVAYNLAT